MAAGHNASLCRAASISTAMRGRKVSQPTATGCFLRLVDETTDGEVVTSILHKKPMRVGVSPLTWACRSTPLTGRVSLPFLPTANFVFCKQPAGGQGGKGHMADQDYPFYQ